MGSTCQVRWAWDNMLESTRIRAFLGSAGTLCPLQSPCTCSHFIKMSKQRLGKSKPLVEVVWLSHRRAGISTRVLGLLCSCASPCTTLCPQDQHGGLGTLNQQESSDGLRQTKCQREPYSGWWNDLPFLALVRGPPTLGLPTSGKLLWCSLNRSQEIQGTSARTYLGSRWALGHMLLLALQRLIGKW